MKIDPLTRQIVATAVRGFQRGSQTWQRHTDGSVDTFVASDDGYRMIMLSLPTPATDIPADVLLDLDTDEEVRRTNAYQAMIKHFEEAEQARRRLSAELNETRAAIRMRLAHERGLAQDEGDVRTNRSEGGGA